MRSKEEANDYRYFPDPDLLPVELDAAYIEAVRATLPELPAVKRARWVRDFGLKAEDAEVLSQEPAVAALYERLAATTGKPGPAANFVRMEVLALLNRTPEAAINEAVVADLVRLSADGAISRASARALFEEFGADAGAPAMGAVIDQRGLKQISDTGAIERIVDDVLAANPDQVAQYRAGKTKVMGFLVGQVMKASAGKANAAQVNELLVKKLA
jgi:aspartyl-tRNA(Asn)/glutamyl-tRNA(Gln) amidotransferase subunit B